MCIIHCSYCYTYYSLGMPMRHKQIVTLGLFARALYSALLFHTGESDVYPHDAAFPACGGQNRIRVLLKRGRTLFASFPTAGGSFLGLCGHCTGTGSWFGNLCICWAGAGLYFLRAPTR